MEIITDLYLGDSKEELRKLPDDSVDLIVTSPPYADQRKSTYGGIHPDKYVKWFLPISKQLLRVLKPKGTFILNIKEKVVEKNNFYLGVPLPLQLNKLAHRQGRAICYYLFASTHNANATKRIFRYYP